MTTNSSPSSPRRPNVIVCMTDQLRPFEIGCYGGSVVRTPNMDRVAAEGVRFDTAVSNNPVCTPARSCLLSGQYSRTCLGYLGNVPGESPPRGRPIFPGRTLPEAFQAEGYRTALIGKWHVGSHPKDTGFDHTVYPKVHHRNLNQTYHDGTGRTEIIAGYAEEHNVRQLDEFLDAGKRSDTPFFVYYNIATPHMPYFDIPDAYKTMYSADDVVIRQNAWVDGRLALDEHWFKIYVWDYLYYMKGLETGTFKPSLELPHGFDLRDLTALYYGMVGYTDACVGRLLECVEKHGLERETLIVFTSDHGDNMGSHGRFNKCSTNEEAIRIPMIYRWPGTLPAGSEPRRITQLIDVMPTLLDLCGLPAVHNLQGTSMAPALGGASADEERNDAFLETSNGQVALRTERYLYSVQLGDRRRQITNDALELYDLHEDPFELHNLVGSVEHAAAAQRLRDRVVSWNRDTPWFGP